MGNEYSKQKAGQKQGNQAFPPARAEERRQSIGYIHANKLLKSQLEKLFYNLIIQYLSRGL
jgi:hypothetical protein